MTVVLVAMRVGVGAVLLLSGVAKAASGAAATERGVASYRLLPAFLVPPAARLLPAAEIAVGACLAGGLATPYAATAAALLLAAVTAGAVAVLARGERVPCGCFGDYHSTFVTWRLVVRNALLALAAAYAGAVTRHGHMSVSPVLAAAALAFGLSAVLMRRSSRVEGATQ